MHGDVSAFVLLCGAILKYFCTNVDITFKKYILCYISVSCNLYYIYWNIRNLNHVDSDLNFTEPAHFVAQLSWGLISLLTHWKCLVPLKLSGFFSEVLYLSFLLSLFTALKKQFGKRK